MNPKLSVVIPTFRRPELLKRAIASALKAEQAGDVQVVVVPNGSDDSWLGVADIYKEDSRVCWHYLCIGNACAARNYGLQLAQGEYVRFLDDDDFLYSAAAEQLQQLIEANADVSTAPLENLRPDGRKIGVFCLPTSQDFTATAFLSIAISGLTQGSVFRRKVVQSVRWSEESELYDDYIWMLDVVGLRELSWLKCSYPVGSYVQHYGPRLSRTRRSLLNSKQLVEAVMGQHHILAEQGRSSDERSSAVASALLTHAHSVFPACPIYLSRWINRARLISDSAVPLQPLFQRYPLLADYLLLVEWALLVPRLISRSFRRFRWFYSRSAL